MHRIQESSKISAPFLTMTILSAHADLLGIELMPRIPFGGSQVISA
jgi:hypothetical protein